MISEAAALREDRDPVGCSRRDARHLVHAGESDRESVDEIGVADAIRPDDGKAAFAHQPADPFLLAAFLPADLCKARCKDDGGADLAPGAAGKSLAHARGRQGEDRDIYPFRQSREVDLDRHPFDLAGATADEVDVARELIQEPVAKDRVTGGVRLRRHADDRDGFWMHHALQHGVACAARFTCRHWSLLFYAIEGRSSSHCSSCLAMTRLSRKRIVEGLLVPWMERSSSS